jgi:hypothetical protein
VPDLQVAIEAARVEALRSKHNPAVREYPAGQAPPVRHVNPGTPNFDWRGWEQIIYWLEELERDHHE